MKETHETNDIQAIKQRLISNIDSFCPLQGSFKDGRSAYDDPKTQERWTLNPLRPDNYCGSFSINLETGLWYDFASDKEDARKGTIVDLYCRMTGKTYKELAQSFDEIGDIKELPNIKRTKRINKNKETASIKKQKLPLPAIKTKRYPDHVYHYYSNDGTFAFWILRWDNLEGKKFLSAHLDQNQTVEFGIPKQCSDNRPLYNLPELLNTIEKPVLVVEGEKCCNAAAELFPEYAVVTWSGGANSEKRTDWKPVNNRIVYLWPDADKLGKKAMRTICSMIRKQAKKIFMLDVSKYRHKWDVANLYVETAGDPEQARKVLHQITTDGKVFENHSDEQQYSSEQDETDDGGKSKSLTDRLVNIIKTSEYLELWKNQQKEACITSRFPEIPGSWKISDSENIQTLLRYVWYHKEPNQVISITALQTVQATIEIIALYSTKTTYISAIRVYGNSKQIYIDIGEDEWKVISITSSGWNIVNGFNLPVRFLRPAGLSPFPKPVSGESLDVLRDLLHIYDDSTWKLILGWIIGCFNPQGPYPGLILHGYQGCGKTIMTRILKQLTDPHKADIRRSTKSTEDIILAAQNSRVLAFDNLSGMSKEMSDLFCTISTGASHTTRKKYTDATEVFFNFCQPWILNGIDDIASRGDLLDRAILITLPELHEQERRSEKELLDRFFRFQPQIFGALCDVLAGILSKLDTVNLPRKPRMADFVIWLTAAEDRLGFPEGTYLNVYEENAIQKIKDSTEADSLVWFINQHLLSNFNEWSGTTSDLFHELNNYSTEYKDYRKDFPRTMRELGDKMKRIKPVLRVIGIEFQEKRLKNARLKSLRRVDPSLSDRHSMKEHKQVVNFPN